MVSCVFHVSHVPISLKLKIILFFLWPGLPFTYWLFTGVSFGTTDSAPASTVNILHKLEKSLGRT